MTPDQIAKSSEHSQQAAFFCWCANESKNFPALSFAFAIPNGGERNKVQASRLKAEGVKPGVPDVFFPYQSKGYNGLWLEFKKPGVENTKNGGLKPAQVDYRDYLQSQNYLHKVVYNWLQAAETVVSYVS